MNTNKQTKKKTINVLEFYKRHLLGLNKLTYRLCAAESQNVMRCI